MQTALQMNRMQITAGAMLLMFALVAWVLPAALNSSTAAPWLERLGGSAPTFAHTAALSLITTGVLGGGRRVAWQACGAWTAINVLLEIGQHPYVRMHLVGWLPGWMERAWLLEHTRGYFINGSFDPIDIGAALLGGMAALLIVGMTSQPLPQETGT